MKWLNWFKKPRNWVCLNYHIGPTYKDTIHSIQDRVVTYWVDKDKGEFSINCKGAAQVSITGFIPTKLANHLTDEQLVEFINKAIQKEFIEARCL